MRPDQEQNDENENELPDLDAHVEKQKRNRERRLWDAKRRQRGSEANTMQETERERDHPRVARGEPGLAALKLHDLNPDEDDAQRDRGIERAFGHADPAEGRRSQREAVPYRKGGDGVHQHPAAANEPDQAKHKQEMVDAAQDMVDAEIDVGVGEIEPDREV